MCRVSSKKWLQVMKMRMTANGLLAALQCKLTSTLRPEWQQLLNMIANRMMPRKMRLAQNHHKQRKTHRWDHPSDIETQNARLRLQYRPRSFIHPFRPQQLKQMLPESRNLRHLPIHCPQALHLQPWNINQWTFGTQTFIIPSTLPWAW